MFRLFTILMFISVFFAISLNSDGYNNEQISKTNNILCILLNNYCYLSHLCIFLICKLCHVRPTKYLRFFVYTTEEWKTFKCPFKGDSVGHLNPDL